MSNEIKPDPENPTIVKTIHPFGHGDPGALFNPRYRENMRNVRDDTACCCYCGRTTSDKRVFAFLTNVGEFAVMEEWDGTFNDHLGLYPVGSDCAKLLKKHGVILYNQDCTRVSK